MNLSFGNPSDKPRPRFGRTAARPRVRRGALPSSLMGLVVFSFTLLVFSTVAYTSSLPGLVMARARAGEDGLFPAIAQALFGEGGGLETGGQKDEADGAADEGPTPKSSSSKLGAVNRPGFTLGGAVLQGVGKPAGDPPRIPSPAISIDPAKTTVRASPTMATRMSPVMAEVTTASSPRSPAPLRRRNRRPTYFLLGRLRPSTATLPRLTRAPRASTRMA